MSETNTNEILTEEQVNEVLNVWDFLEFQSSYNTQFYNRGYYTPDIINRQMQNITMNTSDASVKDIEKALKKPKDSEKILREYSAGIEIQNMYYKRLIRYVSDMPCFNVTFSPKNIEKETDYNSAIFKKDLKVLENFLYRFDVKQEFSTALRQMIRQGVYYCVFRNEGEKYTLQELPPDFCMITGRHDYGMLFDFNMSWFISNYGIDINMYPKVFKKMYRNIFSQISTNYNPSKNVDTRNSTFVYWSQCSPVDGFWAWKLSPELATLTPYYSALFPEMAMQPTIRSLQEDKYFIEASKLLVGIIGTNKDNKSGNVNNQIKITPDVLGKFLGVARQGLAKQIGLTALPMDEIKTVEFDTKERNMLTEHIKNITDQSVASSASLLDDNKLNVAQSKLALAIDENLVNNFYPMFENFLEYYINRLTRKFKFKITLHDTNTPDNRALRAEKISAMFQHGIVDFQDVARLRDENIFEFKKKLSFSNSLGIDKLLTNLMLANSAGASENIGRPPNPNSESEDTQNSIARGTNEV